MRVIVRNPPVEIPGPEDIVTDHSASIALVASQQRVSASRKLLEPDEMPGGAVYGLDLNPVALAKRLLVDQASRASEKAHQIRANSRSSEMRTFGSFTEFCGSPPC